MKKIILPRFIMFFLAFILISFTDPYAIKRISDKDFRYEFYTTNKKINTKENKTYYWFKGGLIHSSQAGMTGELLHDKFTKMYHSNQLAEQGIFKNGLKVGIWKTWHPNGILSSKQIWKSGLRSGKYFRYDESGMLVENGKFSSDLKTGKWTNTETKEITTYRKGIIVKKKPNYSKSEEYLLKQEGIKLEKNELNQKELEITSDALKLASYKAKAKEEKEIAREKAKKEKETEDLAKKAAREKLKETKKQSKNEPKKVSKIKTFFKNLFKKKSKMAK
ncbi:toxin-antitoxin system YwqK family antitoxin [Flavobacterium sp. 5]|uniref:toxin-antitoxin system YwqK family antitoxin n=1 Tax=Flavobacterium sp. 5 TaxID=2035199 RepID=UPI0012FDDA54|nr:hypothetical protein [Flavobacterium sp. 5]